jgi:hypothetical protein
MDKDIFSTRDLALAATLVTLKFPMLGIDIEFEGSHEKAVGYFQFTNSPEIKRAKVLYNQGELLVEPRTYQNAVQNLKATVVNETRELSIKSNN